MKSELELIYWYMGLASAFGLPSLVNYYIPSAGMFPAGAIVCRNGS